jgi:nucleotide-binding universal stress UspA family protein
MEKILVATDFGSASAAAVPVATYVAKQFDSKVDFIHVQSLEGSDDVAGWDGEALAPTAMAGGPEVSDRLDALAQQAVKEGVRSAEAVLVEEQDAFEPIRAYAENEDVNVIIVGAGQESPSGHVFLGTTAARLRRWATKPVWIVKPDAAPPIRRILCPVDMQPPSLRALRNAIHFARKLDAELTVLTVTQAPLGEQGDLAEMRGPLAEGPPELSEPHQKKFDDFLRKFDFHQVLCEKVIRRGRPRHEVVQVAREINADLIVMGSVGRTGLSHMLIGGVARRVAQELPCSVITVRSETPITLSIEGKIREPNKAYCASDVSKQCDRFQHGDELLRQGLADEAIAHYQKCVAEYDQCANAWFQLGEAHTRLGEYEKARQCAANAAEALRRQENQRIENELRGGHVLYRRMFGI